MSPKNRAKVVAVFVRLLWHLPDGELRRMSLMRAALLLEIACFCLVMGCGGSGSSSPGSGGGTSGGPQSFQYFQIVDGADYPSTIQYAYGPSIILKDGVYHVFFCSGGSIAPAFDYVRYVKSTDGGKTWTMPIDMLHGNTVLGACDPSVVYYQGFYYMFFSSAYYTAPNLTQTTVEVARSQNIDGPYLTYTERGTWEDTPGDAKMIIKPLVFRDTGPQMFGAGEPAVVVHNGKLMIWYTDDSKDLNDTELSIYMLESDDPVTWTPSPDRKIDLSPLDSVDVKYDAALQQFVMTYIAASFSQNPALIRSYSSDGMTWTDTRNVIDKGLFPSYTDNAGVAGDELGNTLSSSTLVGFGAPPKLADLYSPFLGDMYGVFLDPP